jgi:chaperonin GroES
MNITPMTDHVLVKRAPREEVSNGILLPHMSHDDKTTTGIVCAVGPKVVDVQVFDRIAFPKYANKEFIVNDQKYLMLRETEIFAVLP